MATRIETKNSGETQNPVSLHSQDLSVSSKGFPENKEGEILKIGGVRWTYVRTDGPMCGRDEAVKVSTLSFTPRYAGTYEIKIEPFGETKEVRVYTPERNHREIWFSGADVAKTLGVLNKTKLFLASLHNLREKGKTRETGIVVNLAGVKGLTKCQTDIIKATKAQKLYEGCCRIASVVIQEAVHTQSSSDEDDFMSEGDD